MSGALRQAVAGICRGGMCPVASAAATTPADGRCQWAASTLTERLLILRAARHRMAARASEFAAAVSPALARTPADTLVTELLPLLDACRFLERNAARILKTRRLGSAGRPLWLGGVQAEVHREPLGHILVIGPANFPLFLAGAQVLQALAAGNTVTWKPGAGGYAVAELVARALTEAGLPPGALQLTPDTVDAARHALAARPDKVVFTGSAAAGESVLSTLAHTATPAVVELSGSDAVIVLPSADLFAVARAIAFGLRLNGGAVCMSPRRLFATRETMDTLRPLLLAALAGVPPVVLNSDTAATLTTLVQAAQDDGATLLGALEPSAQRPLLIDHARGAMAIARADIFAPVLSLLTVPSLLHLHDEYERCDYALTVAIFCARSEERQARTLARTLRAGTVLLNDLIAPTADPRVPFGGRRASGYGVTRGAEGLLEMTAVKTLLVRRGGAMRHLDATTPADGPLFEGLIRATHGRGLRERFRGVQQFITAARQRPR